MSNVDELRFLCKAAYRADFGFLPRAAICDEKWNFFNQPTNNQNQSSDQQISLTANQLTTWSTNRQTNQPTNQPTRLLKWCRHNSSANMDTVTSVSYQTNCLFEVEHIIRELLSCYLSHWSVYLCKDVFSTGHTECVTTCRCQAEKRRSEKFWPSF